MTEILLAAGIYLIVMGFALFVFGFVTGLEAPRKGKR